MLFFAGCSYPEITPFGEEKGGYVDKSEGIEPGLSPMIDPTTEPGVMPYQPFGNILGNDWELVFSDEFNGEEIDLKKWNIDESTKSRGPRQRLGINSWFWKPENVYQKDGDLVLEVHKAGTDVMTNGSINSSNKFMTKFGYMECRVKIGDANKLTHTAFWLQGPNMGNVNETGADGAEIDIFESCHTYEQVQVNIHYDGYADAHRSQGWRYSTPGIHSDYQVWGLLWTDKYLKIYYNGILKHTFTDPKLIPLTHEFLWLSNGASFGEELPDDGFKAFELGKLTETRFDYVRVWRYNSIAPLQPWNNLVRNGGFDNNTSYWTCSPTGKTAIDTSPNGAEENKIYHRELTMSGNTMRLTDVNASVQLSQDVIVTPGKKYTFSFVGRIRDAIGKSEPNQNTTGKELKGQIFSIDGNETVSAAPICTVETQSSEDVFMSSEFTPTTDKVRIRIEKDGGIAFIDDVYIREIEASENN